MQSTLGNTKITVKAVFVNIQVVKDDKISIFHGQKMSETKSCSFFFKKKFLHVINYGVCENHMEIFFWKFSRCQNNNKSI